MNYGDFTWCPVPSINTFDCHGILEIERDMSFDIIL